MYSLYTCGTILHFVLKLHGVSRMGNALQIKTLPKYLNLMCEKFD